MIENFENVSIQLLQEANALFQVGDLELSFVKYWTLINLNNVYLDCLLEKAETLFALDDWQIALQWLLQIPNFIIINYEIFEKRLNKKILYLAYKLFEMDKYYESLQYYQRLLNRDPQYYPKFLQVASSLFDLGEYITSLRWFIQAAKADVSYYFFLCEKGKILLDLEQPEFALDWFRAGIKYGDKRFLKIIVLQAENLFEIKDFQQSLKWYKLVLKLDQEYAETVNNKGKENYQNLGNQIFDLQLFDESSDWFWLAMENNSNYTANLIEKANLLFEMKEYDQTFNLLFKKEEMKLQKTISEQMKKLITMEENDKAVLWFINLHKMNVIFVQIFDQDLKSLLKLKEFHNNIERVKSRILKNDEDQTILINIALTLFNSKQYDKSLNLLKEICFLNQKHFKYFVSLAQTLFDEGQFDESRKWFYDIYCMDKSYRQQFLQIADRLFKQGKLDESFKWYREFVWTEETNSYLICEKATELFIMKNYQEALKWLTHSKFKNNKEYFLEIQQKALILFRSFNYEESFKWFNQILQAELTLEKMLSCTLTLFERNIYDKSLLWFKQIIINDQKYLASLFGQAQILFSTSIYKESLEWFRFGQTIDPKISVVIQQLADQLMKMGEAQLALEWLETETKAKIIITKEMKFEEKLEDIIYKANQLFERRIYNQSLVSFVKAIKMDEQQIDSLFEKSVQLSIKGFYSESLDWFTEVLKIKNEKADVLIKIGMTLFEKKEFDLAFLFFAKALIYSKNIYDHTMQDLTKTLFIMKEYLSAIQWFVSLCGQNVNLNQIAGQNWEQLLNLVEFKDALNVTEKQKNNSSIKKSQMASILFISKEFKQSLSIIKECAFLDRNYFDQFVLLAQKLFNQPLYRESQKWYYEIYYFADQTYQRFYLQKADALFKLGNIEESYKWYYEVLMKEETDVILICDKATELFNNENYSESLKWLTQSLCKNKSLISEEIQQKAFILFTKQKYQESFKWFGKIVTTQQTLEKMHECAMILFERKLFDESFLWFRQISYDQKYSDCLIKQAHILFSMSQFQPSLIWLSYGQRVALNYQANLQQIADELIKKGEYNKAQEWLKFGQQDFKNQKLM